MKKFCNGIWAFSVVAMVVTVLAGMGSQARADTFTFRIASGHPPAVAYAGLMKSYFQPELKERVEGRTSHKVNFVEGYSGSIVKVAETLEGVQNGIVDIGGFCFCFEPSNLPLHAFQVMLPFGTMSPTQSLRIARSVYDQVPYMSEVFEKKFNQKFLAIIAQDGYNLGTTFDWNKVSDLKGIKLAGAGLNLKWLEFAGAVPVQGSLPGAYTGMKTGVYNGWIMFPDAWRSLKLYEPGPYYTEIGFGSISWHGLTMNLRTFSRLPKEVQTIVLEVGRHFEWMTAIVNEKRYADNINTLIKVGTKVKTLPDSVRADWAKSLKDWPQSLATELDKKGLPASKVLKLTLAEAEQTGYEWPVRYHIK